MGQIYGGGSKKK